MKKWWKVVDTHYVSKKKKEKKRKEIQSYIVEREEMKSWKEEWKTKEVHNEVSSRQD